MNLKRVVSIAGVVILVLGLTVAAHAEVQIAARLGFATAGGGKFKSGCWSPVTITLVNNGDTPIPSEGMLVVEAADSDDVPTQMVLPIPEALVPNVPVTVRTFIKPGTSTGGLNVTVKGRDGRDLATGKFPMRNFQDALGPATTFYLLAGTGGIPEQLRRAVLPPGAKPDEQSPTLNDREHDFLTISDPQELPTHWAAYEGVDLLIITTGKEQRFVSGLRDSPERLAALAEWVHRGGRLVLAGSGSGLAELWNSAQDPGGKNVPRLGELLGLKGLTVDVAHPLEWKRLDSVENWVGKQGVIEGEDVLNRNGLVPARAEKKTITVANLRMPSGPTHPVDVVVGAPNKDDPHPLIVQAPVGLGRVMLIAFDLDLEPFTVWSGQKEFWMKLNREIGVHTDEAQRNAVTNQMGWGGDYNELGSQLTDALETFEEVPVVSFGWVALFILLYILVVGPLDYWFLKKVVKRLELTWLTFPTLVLTISIGAYFIAYWLKGNDLKINKADVVDFTASVDPADPTRTTTTAVHGTAWFTLFSPQIKHYTIGLEPSYPGWAADSGGNQDNPYNMIVSAMSRPENVYGGVSRSGSGGLFRRAYQYAPDASGLDGVPIQVWSTKTFAASWQTELPRGNNFVIARLHRTEGGGVAGEIEHHLPTTLRDVSLFFNGSVLAIGDLAPGQKFAVDMRHQMGAGMKNIDGWFGQAPVNLNTMPGQRRNQVTVADPVGQLMKTVLFYNLQPNKNSLRNSSVRDLDESWRLSNLTRRAEELVLYGRTDRIEGSAEQVTTDGSSPTHLWLDKLPAYGTERPRLVGMLAQETFARVRPRLAGTLAQETFVRVYLPVLQK